MQKILMLLTNARTDLLSIGLEMLDRADAFSHFDVVCFLLNSPRPAHMRYVDSFIESHPDVTWDKIMGPGTRPEGIADMQNECVQKYPDSLYMKIDEDVLVQGDWPEKMIEAYEHLKDEEDLALISPLIPNNAMGLHLLCKHFYPDLLAEYQSRYGGDPDPAAYGFTWSSPDVGAWATRRFIDVEAANAKQRERRQSLGTDRYFRFSDRFSIGCIAYDYRHWKKMGGVHPTDEPGWCAWIRDNGQFNVMDADQIVLHYSFGVQVDWLDRSHLVEDLRIANLPDTLSRSDLIRYNAPRIQRIARQLPVAIPRKMKALLSRGAKD